MTFQQYRRKQIAELRPYEPGENLFEVSISAEDMKAGSPKPGDMIARNPKNHKDQWLVAAAYFAENFEALSSPAPEAAGVPGDRIVDAVLSWMVKHDWLDAGNEYSAEDVITALDDNAGSEPVPVAAEELEVVRRLNEALEDWTDLRDNESADLCRDALANIEKLRAENERLTQERDWQYEENINRIAAQGTAEARLAEAADVLDQLLDDMGEEGLCVCQAAKDQARTFLQSLGKESGNA